MIDIEEYLANKGCDIRSGGRNDIRTHCFFCGESEDKNGRLYVQVVDPDMYGVFWCHLCGETGGINKIRVHFGDAPIPEDNDYVYSQIYEDAARYYHNKMFDDSPDFTGFMYLTEKRGLTEETILSARLGWADGNLKTYLIQHGYSPDEMLESGLVNRDGKDFFREGSIIFPYLSRGRVTQLRGKIIGGKTMSMRGATAELYGVDGVRGEKTVLVAEGELDKLILDQLGFAAVGVPGVQTVWKPEWIELIEDAKRFYILYDNDAPGRAGAEKLATAVGVRSRVVGIPGEGNDVSDYFLDGHRERGDFDFLLSKSKGGLLVTPFQAMERWVEIEGNADSSGVKFNIPALDQALSHGLTPGQIVTMIARTNAGKSIMSINMMYLMATIQPELTFLLFSLEQTRNEWFERVYKIHNFYHPGSSPMDVVEFWQSRLALVDKNKINETQFEECLDQVSYDMGDTPGVTIVDYLGYMARGFPGGNPTEKTGEAMMFLKSIGKEYDTRFIVPHQANRVGDIGERLTFEMAKDSAVVEETSDLMLSIWRPDQANLGKSERVHDVPKGTVRSEILKSRDGPTGLTMDFQMTPLTLAIVPKESLFYNRARQEVSYQEAGDTFLHVVNRYKTGSEEL